MDIEDTSRGLEVSTCMVQSMVFEVGSNDRETNISQQGCSQDAMVFCPYSSEAGRSWKRRSYRSTKLFILIRMALVSSGRAGSMRSNRGNITA